LLCVQLEKVSVWQRTQVNIAIGTHRHAPCAILFLGGVRKNLCSSGVRVNGENVKRAHVIDVAGVESFATRCRSGAYDGSELAAYPVVVSHQFKGSRRLRIGSCCEEKERDVFQRCHM
jgi:hypothetical protein